MEEQLSSKVKALYDAVQQLIEDGVEIKDIKVSDITNLAGIGKGTAYDYFENKEDIISSAMFYQINVLCRQIKDRFEELNSFQSIIENILKIMDEEVEKRASFIKYIHVYLDNGQISRLLHKKAKERDTNTCMPKDLIYRIVEIGIENGEIKAQLPKDYMIMTVSSKLLVYAIYSTSSGEKQSTKQQMHKLICDSLLQELG